MLSFINSYLVQAQVNIWSKYPAHISGPDINLYNVSLFRHHFGNLFLNISLSLQKEEECEPTKKETRRKLGPAIQPTVSMHTPLSLSLYQLLTPKRNRHTHRHTHTHRVHYYYYSYYSSYLYVAQTSPGGQVWAPKSQKFPHLYTKTRPDMTPA